MNKTVLNIKILYDKMGNAEKKIADFIISNPAGLIPLSISELAEKCGCGDATVVRFAKRLGFSGYQQLKISLAKEESVNIIDQNIVPGDSPLSVYNKVCEDVYCSLEKTKKAINAQDFQKACDKILSAERIVIFGLGNSAAVAIDMSHKLLRLGFNVSAYTDNHMQAIAGAHLNNKCVAVAITHSGSSKDIVDAIKIAKESGATTLAITNLGKSPVCKFADIILNTVSDETNYSVLGLNSRIAQLTIIDAIYCYSVCSLEDSSNLSNKTVEALQNKKY